jgi:hypothetical protein
MVITVTFTGGASVGGASVFFAGIFTIAVNIATAARIMTALTAFRRSQLLFFLLILGDWLPIGFTFYLKTAVNDMSHPKLNYFSTKTFEKQV